MRPLDRVATMADAYPAGRYLSNVGPLWGASLTTALLAALQGLVVARWLGPAGLGAGALIMSYPALVNVVLRAKSSSAAVRYAGEFQASGDDDATLAAYKLSYIVDAAAGALGFIVITATVWTVAPRLVDHPQASALMLAYGAALLVRSPLSVAAAVHTAEGSFGGLGRVQVFGAASRGAVVLLLVGRGHGVGGFVIGSAIGAALEGVVTVLAAERLVRSRHGRPSAGARLHHLRGRMGEFVRYVLWNDLASLVKGMAREGEILLVGVIAGTHQTGLFRLARSVALLVANVISPLQAVAFPKLSRLAPDGTRAVLREGRHLFLWVGLPLGALALLGLPVVAPAITWIGGSAYQPAGPAAQVMVAAMAVSLAFFWVGPSFLALHRAAFWATYTGGYAACVLVLSAVLVPAHGPMGVAVAWLVSAGAGFAVTVWMLRRSGEAT